MMQYVGNMNVALVEDQGIHQINRRIIIIVNHISNLRYKK